MNITAQCKPSTSTLNFLHLYSRLNHKTLILITTLILGLCITSVAHASMFETAKFKISADFRLRAEHDFDSQNSSGVARDDRTRARVRARVSLDYKENDNISFGMRLRSGSDDSQQSPHITIIDFDDNDTGDAHFNFDTDGSGDFQLEADEATTYRFELYAENREKPLVVVVAVP